MQYHFDTQIDVVEIHTVFEREVHFAGEYADSLEEQASILQRDGNLPQAEAELQALLWWQGAGDIFY